MNSIENEIEHWESAYRTCLFVRFSSNQNSLSGRLIKINQLKCCVILYTNISLEITKAHEAKAQRVVRNLIFQFLNAKWRQFCEEKHFTIQPSNDSKCRPESELIGRERKIRGDCVRRFRPKTERKRNSSVSRSKKKKNFLEKKTFWKDEFSGRILIISHKAWHQMPPKSRKKKFSSKISLRIGSKRKTIEFSSDKNNRLKWIHSNAAVLIFAEFEVIFSDLSFQFVRDKTKLHWLSVPVEYRRLFVGKIHRKMLAENLFKNSSSDKERFSIIFIKVSAAAICSSPSMFCSIRTWNREEIWTWNKFFISRGEEKFVRTWNFGKIRRVVSFRSEIINDEIERIPTMCWTVDSVLQDEEIFENKHSIWTKGSYLSIAIVFSMGERFSGIVWSRISSGVFSKDRTVEFTIIDLTTSFYLPLSPMKLFRTKIQRDHRVDDHLMMKIDSSSKVQDLNLTKKTMTPLTAYLK